MKRIIAFSVALVLLLTAGCAAKPFTPDSPPAVPAAFSSKITVQYGEYTVTAMFTQSKPGSCTLKLLSPPALEPLEIAYDGESCTVTYDSLKFETDLKRFPQTAFGSVVVNTFSSLAANTEITKAYSDGVWTYTGKNDNGTFVLTQSNETGFWQSLTVDDADLVITFTEFKTI